MTKDKAGLSNLAQRVLTAAIALPLFILLLLKGTGIQFAILGSLVILAALYEFYSILKQGGIECYTWLGLGLTGFIVCHNVLSQGPAFVFVWLYALWDKREPAQVFPSVMGTLLGMFYLGWMLSYAISLRMAFPQGGQLVLWLCAMIWCNDTAAYFTGHAWGRHKLAPRISPGKTIEGGIGGLLASILIAWLGKILFLGDISWINITILGVIIGIISQMSDLCESLVKRWAGVKDSGAILPGHGGLLDRIDSLIFTAPVMYYWARIYLK